MALGLATSGIAVYYLGRTVALTAGTGVQRFLNGIWSPAITPTADFYVVSKNIFDPQVDGDSWRLTVDGLVERPLELSLAEPTGAAHDPPTPTRSSASATAWAAN